MWDHGLLEHPAELNINKHSPVGNLESQIHLTCMIEQLENMGTPRGNARKYQGHVKSTLNNPSQT